MISPHSKDAPRHLDLHTGIGGFSLAARWSGYQTIAHSEIEPYCNELLTARFPTVPNLGDVRTLCKRNHDCIAPPYLEHDEALELWEAGEEVDLWCPVHDESFGDCPCLGTDQFLEDHGQPDVITSGFPCQDVSNNGSREGLDGSKSSLYAETPRIARELESPFVLFENVASLKTRGFDRIAEELEAIGYAVGAVVVNARTIEAAHKRERVFGVAHLTGERVERLRAEGIEESRSLAPTLLPLRSCDGLWEIEPDFRRTDDGLPGRMDRLARKNDRLKGLGNSIIPQIAAAIFDILPYLAKRGELAA